MIAAGAIAVGLAAWTAIVGGGLASLAGAVDQQWRALPEDQLRGVMNELRAGGLGSVADQYGY